jgi:hypothetical protein
VTTGLARAGFDIDLRYGQLREGRLAQILAALGPLIEVKSDTKARSTGNLFLEYRQKGRPSGLAKTEAQWWAFEIDEDVWLIVPFRRLRAAAARAYRLGRTARGGDFNNYDGVLVPIDWLTHRFEAA